MYNYTLSGMNQESMMIEINMVILALFWFTPVWHVAHYLF